MKKKILWMLFAVALCVNISSCSKDDDDDKVPSQNQPVVVQTGTLVITNSTSDTYQITMDDKKWTLAGGFVLTLSGQSIGYKNVYAEQLTGYVLYPTRFTYAPKIEAGKTSYIVIND